MARITINPVVKKNYFFVFLAAFFVAFFAVFLVAIVLSPETFSLEGSSCWINSAASSTQQIA